MFERVTVELPPPGKEGWINFFRDDSYLGGMQAEATVSVHYPSLKWIVSVWMPWDKGSRVWVAEIYADFLKKGDGLRHSSDNMKGGN